MINGIGSELCFGVPGIRRIIDALSTILWPSMVRRSGKHAKTRSMVSVLGPPGEEDGLRSLLNADKDPTENNTPLQREMAALEKWLEEGADNEKDPWVGMNLTQVNHSAPSTVKDSQLYESGFDDNFSDFVSAPKFLQGHLDTDGDPPFPSQDEVESMSQRLRGIGISENIDENDPQTPFDLSRVLSTLDVMREEIAGISDEDEKRKAAAKVALALVTGLGG
jgi:Alpha and gamma adaptin binding protein p34